MVKGRKPPEALITRYAAKKLARAAGGLSRITGAGGGTSLPGLLLERLSPGFIQAAAASLSEGIIVVTGTNGKTTTASMVREILDSAGREVVSNRSGANLSRGIATALLDANPEARVGVFEVDEAALVHLVGKLRPAVLVVTNVFRDQLDRFGEAEKVVSLIRTSVTRLPEGARVVANTDDAQLWEAVADRSPAGLIGFGVEPLARDEGGGADAEPETCPRCGAFLEFEGRTLAHLGRAHCPRCEWRSAAPEYAARVITERGLGEIEVEISGAPLVLKTGGVHNAYNAAAAVAAAVAFGVPAPSAVAALQGFSPRFGRSEQMQVEERPVRLLLMKNPAGAGALIRAIASDPTVGALVVSINDLHADGRDISWIWDVDFERLAALGLPMVPSGRRAAEVAVRLRYAGAGPQLPRLNPLEAIQTALAQCPADKVAVVLATYTAMLEVRRRIARSRAARVAD
jgi:lipid II isoglutaminyl synthase (glutamine-hydrolysing)